MAPTHLTAGSPKPTFANDDLVLYSMKFCPYAQRVHLVLDAKNVPYNTIFINLTSRPQWFTESFKKVPALEFPNGSAQPLIESLIISDFIDEKYPQNALTSSDPLAKAHDRVLVQKFDEISGPFAKVVFFGGASGAENFVESLYEKLGVYEDELAKRKSTFFGGEKLGMTDLMLWPWFERFGVINYVPGFNFELSSEKFPKLAAWKEAMEEDEGVKKSFISVEDHQKFIASRDYECLNA